MHAAPRAGGSEVRRGGVGSSPSATTTTSQDHTPYRGYAGRPQHGRRGAPAGGNPLVVVVRGWGHGRATRANRGPSSHVGTREVGAGATGSASGKVGSGEGVGRRGVGRGPKTTRVHGHGSFGTTEGGVGPGPRATHWGRGSWGGRGGKPARAVGPGGGGSAKSRAPLAKAAKRPSPSGVPTPGAPRLAHRTRNTR